MDFWHELKQAIESLRSKGLRNNQRITECLRGIEILETLGGQDAAFAELAQHQPRAEDGSAGVNRWIWELNRKIEATLAGGRVLVLKTMHLTHGLREFFPFDDTTTLAHVEEHLRKCYLDSIHEYITKFTADLLPDGPIKLQFYAGSPREGEELRPLNPETRVATLPAVDTDGVYWWPQSRQPLREPRLTRNALLLGLPHRLIDYEVRSDSILSVGSFWDHIPSRIEPFFPSVEEKKTDKNRSLSDEIERAFRQVLTRTMRPRIDEAAPRLEDVLQSITFQIIGSIPNQKLAIRCGEEVTAVALPSELTFYETGLMETAEAELDKVMAKGRRSTSGFAGQAGHKGKRPFHPSWRNYPRQPR
jgi:hypothetical protein